MILSRRIVAECLGTVSSRVVPLPGADEIKSGVAELGIFLPGNLPAEVEVDCRSLETKSSEGTRIYVAAGPAIKNGRGNELQKRISWREDSGRTTRHWTFSPLF